MQKKILITFLFKEGAGPIFTLEMARGLAKNNCEVHALLSSKIANRRDWEDDNSFKTVTFINTGTRETAIKTTLVFFLKEKKVLKNQFKHIHFDYAISTFYHPWASTVLRSVSKVYNYMISVAEVNQNYSKESSPILIHYVMEKPWNVKFPYKTDYPYFKLMWRLGRKMELVKLYILHRLYRIYQLTLVSKEGRKI